MAKRRPSVPPNGAFSTIPLNGPNKAEMPLVGYGLWKVNPDVTADMVYNAIHSGYRLLDSALIYGNEKQVGQGIQRAINDNIIQRKDLFITTKLWNSYHEKHHVFEAFQKSLDDLGLEYIDLYLMHFPISLEYESFDQVTGWTQKDGKSHEIKVPIEETWSEMENLVNKGLVKNIGISNFTIPLISNLLDKAIIKPVVLQIEHHPYLVQPDLIKFSQDNNLAITAYSSFGGTGYIELGIKKDLPPLLDHPLIINIAQKHRKTTAQILLRWSTQRGIAVIPKSSNPHRLTENLDIFSFALTPMDLIAISELDQGIRYNNPKDEDISLAWLFD